MIKYLTRKSSKRNRVLRIFLQRNKNQHSNAIHYLVKIANNHDTSEIQTILTHSPSSLNGANAVANGRAHESFRRRHIASFHPDHVTLRHRCKAKSHTRLSHGNFKSNAVLSSLMLFPASSCRPVLSGYITKVSIASHSQIVTVTDRSLAITW